MNPENLNMEEITEARRKAIAASIRTIRESIKKWVLKPYFGPGSKVNDPAFLGGGARGFPIRRAELAPGFYALL